MAKKLFDRLLDRAFGVVDDPYEDRDAASGAELQEARDQLRLLQDEALDLKRRNREYFDVIESLEGQRNEWKNMYFTSTAKNMNAHAVYRRQLEHMGLQLKKTVAVVNGFFKLVGKEPVTLSEQLLSLKDDVAADYVDCIEKLTAAAPEDIDGDAERKRIAEALPLSP